LTENDYLPLEPFCSSIFDFVSTGEWLHRIKAAKTMSAQRFLPERLAFE
jgi:hypothetical protein